MQLLLVCFLISTLVTLLVIRFDYLHKHVTADHDLVGVQKFHTLPVPRIGGISLAIAMTGAGIYLHFRRPELRSEYWLLILSALPAFGIGLIEDMTKKVRARWRLSMTMLAALLGVIFLGAMLKRVDIPGLDYLLSYTPIALCFTLIAVGGVANAINIIDGFNGLAGMVSVMIFTALGYVSYQLGDHLLWNTCLTMIGAMLGFLLWNYPRGLIFLGDGGAYLTGFIVAEVSVLLVVRHPEVSAWFPLLVVIYPIFETLFSIFRKTFLRGTSPGVPDGVHLHMLIYKRLVRWAAGSREAHRVMRRNSLTSPYLWLLCSLSIIPALLFWQTPLMLIVLVGCFVVGYLWLYRRIVTFRSPKGLILRRREKR